MTLEEVSKILMERYGVPWAYCHQPTCEKSGVCPCGPAKERTIKAAEVASKEK